MTKRGTGGSRGRPFDTENATIIYHAFHRLFARQRSRFIHAYVNRLAARVHKAEDDDIDEALDVEADIRGIRNALAAAGTDTASDAVNAVVSGIDFREPANVDFAARAFAVDHADTRAGELINDVNDTTSEGLRDLTRQAMAGQWDVDTLADKLEEAGLFSDYRAEMIARTEMSFAQNAGALAAGRAARKAGVPVKKVWTLGPNPCPICEEAASHGTIDLDAEFGDAGDAPPPHPNCMCALELVIEDGVTGYATGNKTPVAGFKAREAVVQAWANASPIKSLYAVTAAGPRDQQMLVDVGHAVANRVGATVKENGWKGRNQKGIERIAFKRDTKYQGQLSRVSDVARMTLIVERPEQSDAAVAELSKHFEVTAEPWKRSKVGYADRTANVRFRDGMIGEVQFMDQKMLDAKNTGGHEQYKLMQKYEETGPQPDVTKYNAARDKSIAIYKAVTDGYSDDWKAALGILGN